jgi:glycosyltransferase involved in cell wall biosynthesis
LQVLGDRSPGIKAVTGHRTPKMNPLVSVVIPAFNSSAYVMESIESVRAQTYTPLEIIVVDDGSTDDTAKKLQTLIAAGSIRYQYQENRGLSSARNSGIALANGKYLQFLDADDLILPTKIEKQVQRLEKANLPTICGTDFRCFEETNTAHLSGGDSFKGNFPLRSTKQLFEFETVIHRWLFPKALVQTVNGFEARMPATEDWLLIWKLAAANTRFDYLDEPLALYRKHGGAMTTDFERLANGHLLAIDEVADYQTQHGVSIYSKQELNELRESYQYEAGLFHLRAGRTRRAWSHLFKALLLAPNRRQVKLLLLATLPWGASALPRVGRADDRLWRWRAQLRKTLG